MKSREVILTLSCVGILLYVSGTVHCQSRTGTRTGGTRMLGGGARTLAPGMRLRNVGSATGSQLTNQTDSRRGSPRLLGFIIPSANGGRPQLRLMPGSRIGTGLAGRRGSGASQIITGIPSDILNRGQSVNGMRGTTRSGQIRRLPQSALNTISAARASSPTRQPNIVFVRPPARSSATRMSPELIRRIRLAALRRAAAQRGTATGSAGVSRSAVPSQSGISQSAVQLQSSNSRNGMQPQPAISRNAVSPQFVNRSPQIGIQRTGTRPVSFPDSSVRRRINAMNAAGGVSGDISLGQPRTVSQRPPQPEVRRTTPRRPTRVDEAVLRANIVPVGVSPVSDGVTRVVSSSSSSSSSTETTDSSSSTSSTETRISSSGIGGIVQTDVQGVQPTQTIVAAAPELQFRTSVDGKSTGTVVAPGAVGAAGIARNSPVLESGPPFQVVSGAAQPNIIVGPGSSVAESVSLDIGAAAGPALVVNPTVVDPSGIVATLTQSGAIAPAEEATIVGGGAALPVEDPTIVAAAGPSIASISGLVDGSAIGSVMPTVGAVGGMNAQVLGAIPALGSAENPGISAIVPGQGLVLPGNVPTPLVNSNPDMNSLKTVITDVLRDMAANGKSSNTQPDISEMARAVLRAEQHKLNTGSTGNLPKTQDNKPSRPVIQQTFTLSPTSSVIVNADGMLLPTSSRHQNNSTNFFGDSGINTVSLHTAKPVITAKPTSMLVSPTILETAHVTDPHAIDLFHTHDPHDSAHGHIHSHPNMIPQDLAHQPLVLHQSDIGFTSKSRQTKVPIVNTRATTAAPPSKQQANDQLNLIVGDWTGAEKTLAGPPPPPKTDLALDHPHGHHHFQSHVHGVSKAPSIPPPPPLSGHSESSQQGNKTMTNDFRNQPPTSEKFTVDKGAFGTANNNAGNVDTPMLINNLPTANTGHLNHDPSPIFGPDFSANNRQSGSDGVSIAVPAASSGIDSINTIAIENKLFDANMPSTAAGVEILPTVDTNSHLPVNVIAERPALDTTKPIGEQLMKQLPVPKELVSALSGGTVDNTITLGKPEQPNMNSIVSENSIHHSNTRTQNVVTTDTSVHSDQGFSLNNVRDGLILDTIPTGLQVDSLSNMGTAGLGMIGQLSLENTDPLSAPSLDKLAQNIPNEILSSRNALDSTIQLANAIDTTQNNVNSDPTVRKIANILPKSDPRSRLPLMTLDAKGFSAEGRFNTVQRGFNKTTRLSSENGINVQVQLTPHSSTETKSTNSENRKQEFRTANIQTDGSFLGSRLPVPQRGAGKAVTLTDLSKQPFYDQTSLIGAFVDVLPMPAKPQIVPVDIPVPPPQTDILMVPADAGNTDSNLALNVKQPGAGQMAGVPQPPVVAFTSTLDVPGANSFGRDMAQPVSQVVSTDFVSIENNPNWAVFDPTALSADINFADINPVINGIMEPGSEIAFINANDIQFTNAFDVSPVVYDPVPNKSTATSSTLSNDNSRGTPQTGAPVSSGETGFKSTIKSPATGATVSFNTVSDNVPNNRRLQFKEVVIAPLPSQTDSALQGAIDILPPPPPIF